MTNLNRIILIGRAIDVPQLKYTTENVPFCRFTLAVERPAWGQGGQPETDRFPVVLWRRAAEIAAEYLSQNELVLIEGRIQERSFNTEEGRKSWVTEIIAGDLKLLGGQKKAAPAKAAAPGPKAPNQPEPTGPAEAAGGLDNFSMPYFPMPEDETPEPGGLAF